MELLIILKLVCIPLTILNVFLIIAVVTSSSQRFCLRYLFNPNAQENTSASIGSYPSITRIIVKSKPRSKDLFHCSSTIISSKWVVTTASCIILLKEGGFNQSQVYVSSKALSWHKGRKHGVLALVYHENYNPESNDNDIGMIKVKQPFRGMASMFISVASKDYLYGKEEPAVKMTSWALNSNKTEIQKSVDVEIITQELCRSSYSKLKEEITNKVFCVNYDYIPDICKLSSGGAVVHDTLLIGIIIWADSCNFEDLPAVILRISLYEDWMKNVAKKLQSPLETTFKSEP